MDIELNGLAELKAAIEEHANTQAVQAIVKKNGAGLQAKMQREAVFVKGYSTGSTRRSISLSFSDAGMTATVAPGTLYSPYLEYGTRYMAAQPFVGSAFHEQEVLFLNDLQKLVR